MSLINLIKAVYMEMCDRFDMDKDSWNKYIAKELMKKKEMMDLLNLRHAHEELWEVFPQGLPGTALNAFCLYGIIRNYNLKNVIETGVANGYYTAHILSAVIENGGTLDSVELSDHEDIAMYVPKEYRDYEGWTLHQDINSLDFLKEKVPHSYDLCCHDSLHTKEHMEKEINFFKNTDKENFFIFVDDQNSENFWEYCFNVNLQSKRNYIYKVADGRFGQYKGHLGGFLKYNKKQ